MVNPLKGEVEFTALGQQWRAVLDTEAKIGVEDEYDKGFVSIMLDAMGEGAADEQEPGEDASEAEQRNFMFARFGRMRLGYQRGILFHAVRRFHADVTRVQVSQMLDDLGAGAMAVLGQLISRAQPKCDGADPDASAEGKASPAPKRSKGRTGRRA